MQPVLTTAQSRAFDKYLIEEIGIPSLVLMENAARGALAAIEDWLKEKEDQSIAIFCGPGNNGGDGLALARLLHERDFEVIVILTHEPDELSTDARAQYEMLIKVPGCVDIYSIEDITTENENKSYLNLILSRSDIWVDALLGTGSHGEIRGTILDAMNQMPKSGRRVLALDLPTGLDADIGTPDDNFNIIQATRTVAMGAPKLGFYTGNSRHYTGDIHVANLGARILHRLLSDEAGAYLVDDKFVSTMLPRFSKNESKFSRGRVLAICGSRGMTGAAIMSGSAAMKSGSGLVTVALPESQRSIVAQAMPELLTIGLPEDENGNPVVEAWDKLKEQIEKADAIIIGSGLGAYPGVSELVLKILSNVDKPVILDGGALAAIIGHLDVVKSRMAPTVLTPHVGEIAKLAKRPWEEVERDRINVARAIAASYDVTVVMKGAPTYTIKSDGSTFINTTGNPGLATAGSGDVLGGIIATMLTQCIEPGDDLIYIATFIAVYLHGLAGDFAAKEKTTHSMTATDIIAYLPHAFKSLGVE